MKKIVITGGPCSGKTTIIEELNKKGFPILTETAKDIVKVRRHLPMTKEEMEIRQELILKKQLKKEEDAEKNNFKILFLDRSLIDSYVYSSLYCKDETTQKHLLLIENKKYHKIFLLEPLPFNSEGFRQKNEDNEKAKEIHNAISGSYKKLGYEIIFVPIMSIQERINFILKKLNLENPLFS